MGWCRLPQLARPERRSVVVGAGDYGEDLAEMMAGSIAVWAWGGYWPAAPVEH
jgi:hypothetical protein